MRELKFRAWDTIDLCFVCDEWINENIAEVGAWFWYGNKPKEIIIMQYTGLKDKNGKEIYEGDIVVVDWGCNDYLIGANKLNKPFVMEFRNYSWFPFSHILPAPHDIEVIGNIYENPELLEST